MKSNSNFYLMILFLLTSLILMSGCKDVFEQDITKKEVSINSPLEGAQSVVYKQLFWWNKLEGATQYSIQIATPSFDSLVSIVTDTVVIGVDKFYKTLAPGKYQWRIRAENGGYKTSYQTYNLTMLVSPLELQEVNLVAPANNDYSGASSNGLVDFSWEELTGATKYIIQVDTITGNFGSNILLEDVTTDPMYTYTFASEGDYKWRIKAQDDSGNETSWSSVYNTGYYATTPAVPVLSSPSNNTTVTNTSVTFSWNAVARAKTYTLHVYRNSSDTMVASTETYPVLAPTTSKSVSLTSAFSGNLIYWRVSATDKAGNTSNRSNRRIISIQ